MKYLYNRFTMNVLTIILTAAFFAIPLFALGSNGLVFMLGIFAVTTFFLFERNFDPAALPGVEPLSPYYNGPVYRITADLSQRAGLDRVPRIFIKREPIGNAAAVETSEGPALIVSQGLFELLNYEELEAVLAHEISHIKNRDLHLLTILSRFRMMISAIPQLMLAMLFFMPLLFLFLPLGTALFSLLFVSLGALLVERAIMRLREFGADYGAAELTHNPAALARALDRLDHAPVYVMAFGRPVEVDRRRAELNQEGIFAALFRSHPKTESRIRFLKGLSQRWNTGSSVSWRLVN